MSTKALRKALEMMRTDPMSQDFGDRPEYREAIKEVEAIEAAAKHYVSFEDMTGAPDDLMESIARDAP